LAAENGTYAPSKLELRRSRDDRGADLISLSGELDLGNCAPFRTALEEALEDDAPIVVDMRALEFIDSTGIALIVAALREGDGRLRFRMSESAAVARVFDLTGITDKLPVADS
jgi:anti-sigma B factor antagonist